MAFSISVSDYDFSGNPREFTVEKYPSFISYDGGRLNIDGVNETLLVSHDFSVDITELKITSDEIHTIVKNIVTTSKGDRKTLYNSIDKKLREMHISGLFYDFVLDNFIADHSFCIAVKLTPQSTFKRFEVKL